MIVSRPEPDGAAVLPTVISTIATITTHFLDALITDHPPRTEAAATGPVDPGFWLYSSGSTGRPKGTLHTHANPYWKIGRAHV